MTKTYSINRKYALRQFENVDMGVEGLESPDDIAKELARFDAEVETYKQRLEEEKNKQEELKEPFGDRKGPRPTGFPKVPKSVPF